MCHLMDCRGGQLICRVMLNKIFFESSKPIKKDLKDHPGWKDVDNTWGSSSQAQCRMDSG